MRWTLAPLAIALAVGPAFKARKEEALFYGGNPARTSNPITWERIFKDDLICYMSPGLHEKFLRFKPGEHALYPESRFLLRE